MSLDIVQGDILVAGSQEYNIRAVESWAASPSQTKSFAHMATVFCQTKRSPAVVAGKRGAPALSLDNLYCTPIDPVDGNISREMGIETPFDLRQTFIADTTSFVHLIVEKVKV